MKRERMRLFFRMVGMGVGLVPMGAIAQELSLVAIGEVGVFASPQEAVAEGAVPIAELAPGQFTVLQQAAGCPDAEGGTARVCGRLEVRGVEVYTVVVDTPDGCRAGYIRQSNAVSIVATSEGGYQTGAPAGCFADRIGARGAPEPSLAASGGDPTEGTAGWNNARMVWSGQTQCNKQQVDLQLRLWGPPSEVNGLLTVFLAADSSETAVPIVVRYEPGPETVLLAPTQNTTSGPVSNWTIVGTFADDLRTLNATLTEEALCAPFTLSRTE